MTYTEFMNKVTVLANDFITWEQTQHSFELHILIGLSFVVSILILLYFIPTYLKAIRKYFRGNKKSTLKTHLLYSAILIYFLTLGYFSYSAISSLNDALDTTSEFDIEKIINSEYKEFLENQTPEVFEIVYLKVNSENVEVKYLNKDNELVYKEFKNIKISNKYDVPTLETLTNPKLTQELEVNRDLKIIFPKIIFNYDDNYKSKRTVYIPSNMIELVEPGSEYTKK